MKLKKRKDASLPHPQEVLDGRVALDVHSLLDLIHAVNPTGRNLRKEETDERYALKSRLQSKLIREFPGALHARNDDKQPGFVLLDLTLPGGRNACHAKLDELDEDARALLQHMLDVGNDAREQDGTLQCLAFPTQAELAPWEQKLLAGRLLQDAYDYEAARQNFTEAFDESDGDGKAAEALLALLVECLAADEEALELGETLSKEALLLPEVRLLLALSCARQQLISQAREHLSQVLPTGSEAPRLRSAEVHLALFRALLAQGDVSGAEEALEEVSELQPTHPSLATAYKEVREARDASRAPMEEELAQLLSIAAMEEAEALAREILVRFSDSEIARRTLRNLREERRKKELQTLQKEALQSLSRGRPALAIPLLKQALAGEVSAEQRAEFGALLAQAEEEERKQEIQARLEETVALFSGAELGKGLYAYLALPVSLRKEVDTRCQLPQLALVTEILGHWHGHGHGHGREEIPARSVVDAVQALTTAGKLLATDPEAALAVVSAESRLLSPLPLYKSIVKEAQDLLRERRQKGAHAAYLRARVAYDRGDLDGAQHAIAGLDLRLLSEEEQTYLADMTSTIRDIQEHRTLRARLTRCRSQGSFLYARVTVEQMLQRAKQDERHQLLCEREEILEEVRRSFHAQVMDGPDPCTSEFEHTAYILDELSDLDLTEFWVHGAPKWMVPGTFKVVFAQNQDDLIFLRIVDFEHNPEGTVVWRMMLKMPARFVIARVEVDDKQICLLDKSGSVLVVSHETGDVLRHSTAQDLGITSEGERVGFVELMRSAEGRYLWMISAHGLRMEKDGPNLRFGHTKVIDLERPGPARDLGEHEWTLAIHGTNEPLVACHHGDHALGLYSSRGVLQKELKFPSVKLCELALVHPSGEGGFLVVVYPKPTKTDDAEAEVDEDHEDPDGQVEEPKKQSSSKKKNRREICEEEISAFVTGTPLNPLTPAELDDTWRPLWAEEEGSFIEDDERFHFLAVSPDGDLAPPRRFQKRTEPGFHVCTGVTALAPRISVALTDFGQKLFCVGYGDDVDGLKDLWTAEAPLHSMLVGDVQAERALLLSMLDEGLYGTVLGEAPPEPPPLNSYKRLRGLSEVLEVRSCTYGLRGDQTAHLRARVILDGIAGKSKSELRQFLSLYLTKLSARRPKGYNDSKLIKDLKSIRDISDFKELRENTQLDRSLADMLVDIYEAFDPGTAGEAMSLYMTMLRKEKLYPYAHIVLMSELARTRDWPTLEEELAKVSLEGLTNQARQHIQHLKGLLHLGKEDPAQAYAALKAGEAIGTGGRCFYGELLEYVRPVTDPAAELTDPDVEYKIRHFLCAIVLCDMYLHKGSLENALVVIDRRVVHTTFSLQGLARLCQVYLLLPVASTSWAVRFRKALVLSRYREVYTTVQTTPSKEIPLPTNNWTKERLDALYSRATEALRDLGLLPP